MAEVLVVDDEPGIARMIRLLLTLEGVEVRVENDAAKALAFLERERVRVILLDLNMPVMDGRTFFRSLRARGDATPVVLMSAHEPRVASRELGADGFLEKPFLPDDLVDCVNRFRAPP
ncbi:MAG TPA: response regulator [Tepidiformaceae bacterium]|nr:response regulator [Tepidiformaceae bacterium]